MIAVSAVEKSVGECIHDELLIIIIINDRKKTAKN